VGGGLAGCEAAFALARRGLPVSLVEMRPVAQTPAHRTDRLAELVCTNSFKSTETHNAHGLLKAEMRLLGSIVLEAADDARVPGGSALVVDRDEFAGGVERRIDSHPLIQLVREEVDALPSPGVVATGPLTSDRLATSIAARVGAQALAFYDAIAPVVAGDSLDLDVLYRASRYGKGAPGEEGGAYLNAPLDRDTYERLIDALVSADQYAGQDFDPIPYFEGCLPVEEMARRGRETLRFGPLKPVGLPEPGSGRTPHAVVQLRREDRNAQMWSLVGFQTRLRTREQQRVFRQIPGLGAAEFLRYGSVHRNSYLNTPAVLGPALQARDDEALFFAGQLTGVEGYTESAATGILAGENLARVLAGEPPLIPPPTTMLGGLLRYLRDAEPGHFQPMNANFGLLEPLEERVKQRARRKSLLAERALAAMQAFAASLAGPVRV
jgi:methylenetetrahydrofolate--tRNA-(uracil-5-)-methyltransferase